VAFQKGLALNAFHASSESAGPRVSAEGQCICGARTPGAFPEITAEHLGAPFGAGYGDQGRFSLAELPLNSVVDVPMAIPVHFAVQPNAFVLKALVQSLLRWDRAPARASSTTMPMATRSFPGERSDGWHQPIAAQSWRWPI